MTTTLHGSYAVQNDIPATGWVIVEADTEGQVIRDTTGKIVFQGPWKLRLIGGEFTAEVPSSDDPTSSPQGYTLTVTEALDHVDEDDYRVVTFEPLDGETVELADLVSEDEAALVPSYSQVTAAALLGLIGDVAALESAASALTTLVANIRALTDATFTTGLATSVDARVQSALDALDAVRNIEHGAQLGKTAIVADELVIDVATTWGIDPVTGPYFDDAGVDSGEEAVLFVGDDGALSWYLLSAIH